MVLIPGWRFLASSQHLDNQMVHGLKFSSVEAGSAEKVNQICTGIVQIVQEKYGIKYRVRMNPEKGHPCDEIIYFKNLSHYPQCNPKKAFQCRLYIKCTTF